MVVVNHFLGGALGGIFSVVGGFGVEIFFAISGFIMVYTQAGKSPGRFILNRAIRIYPMYWVIAFPLLSYGFRLNDIPGLLGNLLLLPSIGNPHYGMLFYPAWTLVYEMLFYAMFFLSLIISSNKITSCLLAVLLIASSIFIFSHLMEFPRQNRSNLGYILGDHIMLDFAAGCVLALLYRKVKIRVSAIFFFGAVIFITWAAFRLKMPTKYLDFLFSASIVLFAVISYPAQGLIKSCLMKIGDASYSIYLSHIYFVYLLLELVEGKGNTNFHYIIISISVLALSIVFGLAIHRFIEAPLINHLKSTLILRRRVENQDG